MYFQKTRRAGGASAHAPVGVDLTRTYAHSQLELKVAARGRCSYKV